MRPRRARSPRLLAALAGLGLLAAGCRQDMHDQPRIKPLGANDFFADGQGARPLPAHAVARGDLRADVLHTTGFTAEGDLATAPPMKVTRELLVRGRDRFNVFCSPCHGRTGEGRGMVVQRGYKQPTSFHDERLRQVPVGYVFDVVTNGFGVMPSYASQIPIDDRWAIVAYLRTLQLSRHFDAAILTAEERAALDAPQAATAATPHAPAAATDGH